MHILPKIRLKRTKGSLKITKKIIKIGYVNKFRLLIREVRRGKVGRSRNIMLQVLTYIIFISIIIEFTQLSDLTSLLSAQGLLISQEIRAIQKITFASE